MRCVQVSRPKGPLELVERDDPGARPGDGEDQDPGLWRLPQRRLYEGRDLPRHSVSARARSRNRRHHRCRSERECEGGRRDSASASAGMADTAVIVTHVGAAISSRAAWPPRCQASPTTVAMRSSPSFPPKRSRSFPTSCRPRKPAPLMCAGITTFNPLRHSRAMAGDVVAILGIGGLGHLGVQFAAKMGFRTVAIARGADKEPLARRLGATDYVDSDSQNPAEELKKLGGATVILATATSGNAMTAALGGLAIGGTMIVVGAPADPLQVPAGLLIGGRRSIAGWPSGRSIDSQDTLRFSALTGVRSMNEVFPLERAAEAYDRMMSGQARFRVVLSTGA